MLSEDAASKKDESIDVNLWTRDFSDQFPNFKRPAIISSFSIDSNRKVAIGDENKNLLNWNLCQIFQRKNGRLSVPEMDLKRGFKEFDSDRTEKGPEYLKVLANESLYPFSLIGGSW